MRAHTHYLLLEEKQRQELGAVDHDALIMEWKNWVDNTLVKEQLQLKNVEKNLSA